MSHAPTRRGFLSSGPPAGAFLALPAAVYRSALGGDEPPSERVHLGFIGVGNQSGRKNNLRLFTPRAPVVALCDVDDNYFAEAAKYVTENTPTTFRRHTATIANYSNPRMLMQLSSPRPTTGTLS
jgi:hypothetical protein